MNSPTNQKITQDLKIAFRKVVNKHDCLLPYQFAKEHNLNEQYVQKLCREGKLIAEKYKGKWLILNQRHKRYKRIGRMVITKG